MGDEEEAALPLPLFLLLLSLFLFFLLFLIEEPDLPLPLPLFLLFFLLFFFFFLFFFVEEAPVQLALNILCTKDLKTSDESRSAQAKQVLRRRNNSHSFELRKTGES
jgi:hypothetical protein